MKKRILIAVGIVLLVFFGWRVISLFTNTQQAWGPGQGQTVAVEVSNVSIKQIKEVREFTGSVYPIYQYVISPKVSGRVIEITKRLGDWVNKGEIIARLDDAEYQQTVLESQANLRISKASLTESESQLELARQELERVRSLQEKGISSSSELDTSSTSYEAQRSRLELARAQVQQREAALKSPAIRLDYTVLYA